MKKVLIAASVLLLLLTASAAGALYYYIYAPQFFPAQTAYVHIDRDDTADSVCHKVLTAGNARSIRGFRWMAEYRKYDNRIHTGRYVIRPDENVYHVFSRLYRGYQEPTNLTIGSVRTLDRLARLVGSQLMIDSAEIAAAMNDSAFRQRLGYSRETLPCLFIPDTYQVYWDMSVEAFFARMQEEHRNFWNDRRLSKAKAIGMTAEEVCTLASIVEEETNNRDEKPTVAGLYINRLRRGMPLQADPTIKFALQDFTLRRILNRHLDIDSPYNTYRNTGLPPGPIRIPTPIGIDAVLNHARHPYLYMCAKEDFSGTHNFAATYAEHCRNARRYQRALNERKIY